MAEQLTVHAVFRSAGLRVAGSNNWREPLPEQGSGIYVIAVVGRADASAHRCRIERVLGTGYAAEYQYWIPDQPVIYIGRAKNLRKRLNQFYRHRYGQPRPHRGGQVVTVMKCQLWVYWAVTDDFVAAERTMLTFFRHQIGRLPFANRV